MSGNLTGLKGLFIEDDLQASVYNVLKSKGLFELEDHIIEVVAWCDKLAKKFKVNREWAMKAALLHDIGKIVPSNVSLIFCEKHGVGLIKEEVIFPDLAHQKISRYLANHYFEIEDEGILTAIGHHSTLREGASDLDKILFLADKLSFEEAESESARRAVLSALDSSLNKGVYVYLKHMMADKTLMIIHPDFKKAYKQLVRVCNQA